MVLPMPSAGCFLMSQTRRWLTPSRLRGASRRVNIPSSMVIVRLIVAWVLMAALPLQGFAAATMLMCDHGAISVQAANGELAAHGHHHPGGQENGGFPQASAPDTAEHAHGGQHLAVDMQDKVHACGICASCCHVVGLSHAPSPMPSVDSPSAELPQTQFRILTRASPRPDKPPRV